MAEPDRRAALRRRYLSLGFGEWASVAAIGYVALAVVLPRASGDREAVTAIVGFVPLLVILGQAGAYWLLARGWVHLHPMPRRLARLYRCFRVLDVLLLFAACAYLCLRVAETGWVGVLAVGLWLFAVVEFVNYYVVRVSYPVRTWFVTVGEWRTPRLLQDLRRADGASV